jgi:hypothetical protein
VLFGAAALLAGCGGGGGGSGAPPVGGPPVDAAPEIQAFVADKAGYLVGERATLTARFSGGTARIEPSLGVVQSGVPVETEALDSSRELRLVVESPRGTVSRALTLSVQYRDRYRPTGTGLRSRGHTATLAGDGTVVVIGGSRGLSILSNSIDRFDPRTGNFAPIGVLANGREGHRTVRLANGKLLVTGGETVLADWRAELVDERTGAVEPAGTPSVPRYSHSAVPLPDGRVMIAGGFTAGEGAGFGISRSAEIWDPATRVFRRLASTLRTARAGHGATVLPDGRVLLAGGFSEDANYSFAEIFDPATETFSIAAAVDNRQRGNLGVALLPDGSVLMIGGESAQAEPSSAVQRFRATGFDVLAGLVRSRTFAEPVVLRDGRVMLFGGEIGPGNVTTDTAESYSAANGGFPIASLPEPRVGLTATRLNDGRVLIVGGESASGVLIPSALLYE